MSELRSAVFDCNIFLQAMLSTRGPSYACWEKVIATEVRIFISPYILTEIRTLPSHKSLKRFTEFTSERVERFIEELLEYAELTSDPISNFQYPRDSKDALYVDLAIVSGAMLIVSNDNDLLDLMNEGNSEGKKLRQQHPNFSVVTP